jgi:hypothetical protein
MDVKFLADGTPVVVVGDGPDREVGDAQGTTHPQLVVARLTPELVEAGAVFDTKPEPAPEAAAGQATPAAPAAPAAPAPTPAETLAALHAAGTLTDDEYAAAQARLG